MKTVKIKDKEFTLSIESCCINRVVNSIALRLNNDYKDEFPLIIVVLNGAFMFASDLLKQINFLCEVSFVKINSYKGTETTNKINTLIGLNENIKDRKIIIIEDIVDTGNTISFLIENIKEHQPASIKVCSMFCKTNTYKLNINIDYVGLVIPDDFIIGYGLDYDGHGRNFKDVYKLI